MSFDEFFPDPSMSKNLPGNLIDLPLNIWAKF